MVESGTCYHLTGDTPSVRPFGLPAPPPGSRVQPPLKGEDGATAPEGSAAVRRIPFEMHQGEFEQATLASPGGVAERSESFNNNDCRWQSYLDPIAGRLDGSSEPARLTEEGWRQPRYCLHFVQWHRLRVITVYLTIFRVIYHMEKGFHKTSTLLHSPNSS